MPSRLKRVDDESRVTLPCATLESLNRSVGATEWILFPRAWVKPLPLPPDLLARVWALAPHGQSDESDGGPLETWDRSPFELREGASLVGLLRLHAVHELRLTAKDRKSPTTAWRLTIPAELRDSALLPGPGEKLWVHEETRAGVLSLWTPAAWAAFVAT